LYNELHIKKTYLIERKPKLYFVKIKLTLFSSLYSSGHLEIMNV